MILIYLTIDCVYILFSEQLNRFYTGATSNFDVRMYFHFNDIQTRKFTKKANDWQLFLKIDCSTRANALKIERHIKLMKSSVYINNLKKYPEMIDKLIARLQTDC